MRIQGILILFISLACLQTAVAQDNTTYTDKLINLPARFNERMQKKTEKLWDKLMKTDSNMGLPQLPAAARDTGC